MERSTELVVDGFQCSGNSYLCRWLIHANPSLDLQGHFHSSAQVLRARKLGVPAVVLIRHPIEVTASAITRWPWLTPELVLRRWARYYTAVEPRWGDLTVIRSEELFADLPSAVRLISTGTGVALELPRPKDRLSEDDVEAASRIARSTKLAEALADSSRWNMALTSRADDLYKRLWSACRT